AIKTPKNDSKTPSTRSIAQDYGLSKATLRRAIKNNGPLTRPGRAKILTDHEEEQLVSYCLAMQRLGFGLTKSGVNQYVMDIVRRNRRPYPFGENGLGQKWWKCFMNDHPELSFRILQALNEARFVIEPRLQKVLVKKSARQVHQVSYGSSHKHISLCPTISAAGTYILPLFIFKRNQTIPGLLRGAPAGSVMGFTETGYMWESLFQKYIEHFVSSIPSAHPILLILDGHKSHVNYISINFCYENNILLYTLPPHTTHILQPAELPFATLKKTYNKECNMFQFNKNGQLVTKYMFAEILGSSYITTYTPTAICNAFRAMGIWPFNPNAISPDHLEPSLTME
ncbi:20005_t:CDS:2, partial [Cetraspora pellucida]